MVPNHHGQLNLITDVEATYDLTKLGSIKIDRIP